MAFAPGPARLHAEPLDDGALLFALLLRVLRLRAALPRPLPRSAPGCRLRSGPGVQHVFRGIAIGGALIGEAFSSTSGRQRRSSSRPRSLAACLVPILFVAEDGGHGRCSRAWGLPGAFVAVLRDPDIGPSCREHGLGGHPRRCAHLCGALRDGRPRRAARHLYALLAVVAVGSSSPRCRRHDRRPRRHRTRDHLSPRSCTASVLAGGLGTTWHAWYLGLIFVVAIAGGMAMTLAWGSSSSSCPPTSAAPSPASRPDDEGDWPRDRAARGRGGDRHSSARTSRRPTATRRSRRAGIPILLAIPLVARLIGVEQAHDAGLLGEQRRETVTDQRDAVPRRQALCVAASTRSTPAAHGLPHPFGDLLGVPARQSGRAAARRPRPRAWGQARRRPRRRAGTASARAPAPARVLVDHRDAPVTSRRGRVADPRPRERYSSGFAVPPSFTSSAAVPPTRACAGPSSR